MTQPNLPLQGPETTKPSDPGPVVTTTSISTKPNYVSDKGWFFEIYPRASDCHVWHNGEKVSGVTKVKIEIDVEDIIARAQVEIIKPMVRCSLPNKSVCVQEFGFVKVPIMEEDPNIEDPEPI